jgi:hypothetical protein
MTIKPIETHYKGYRFRSRLEARWAVFFDELGLRWEYEREGFDLGDGTYTVRLRGGDQFSDIIEALKSVIPAPFRRYDPDARQLHLLESAPAELVAAAKKTLATLYHPDKPGGDLRRMQEVNNAADVILKV